MTLKARLYEAHFNRFWVMMWAVNVTALLALFAIGTPPATWTTAFVVLFLLPEMIGAWRRGDSLPPLTYAVRRYVPRWVPDAVTGMVGTWMAWIWLVPRNEVSAAHHPLLVAIIIAGFVFWLINHWDVTYDGPGE